MFRVVGESGGIVLTRQVDSHDVMTALPQLSPDEVPVPGDVARSVSQNVCSHLVDPSVAGAPRDLTESSSASQFGPSDRAAFEGRRALTQLVGERAAVRRAREWR